MYRVREALTQQTLMDQLSKLNSCALITTGRTGSDFLQSLFDSHPEILTFNGPLLYHSFWDSSVCVKAGDFDLSDFVEEFIGKNIHCFKSRYDLQENKHQLGKNFDQSIDIDLEQFKTEFHRLLAGIEINSKTTMLAIYASYALCLGHDLGKKELLFHHLHHADELDRFLQDFPDSKIIAMTRDPRANFTSGIEHHRAYDPANKDNGAFLNFYIERILIDADVLVKYQKNYKVVKIESLGNEEVMKKLCDWLSVSYNDSLKKSTWGGLTWYGDRLSNHKFDEKRKAGEWSGAVLNNGWQKRLDKVDQYVLNYLMYHRLKHYGYPCKSVSFVGTWLMPILILKPLAYELRFFGWSYLCDCFRNGREINIVKNVFYYFLRVFLFMKYYVKTFVKRKFSHPYL